MARYLVARLLAVPPLLLGVSVVVFLLLRFSPGDPAERILSQGGDYGADRAAVEALRHELGLDLSLPAQYGRWLAQLGRGDLGRSFATRRPVVDEIGARLPATLQLAGTALVLSILLALPLGVLSAWRPGGPLDLLCRLLCLGGVSLPSFWLGLLLAWLFAVQLGWLPAIGRGGPQHLVLPALALGAGIAAGQARLLRAALLDALARDYTRLAHAKGLPLRAVVLGHALRNALLAPLTALGLSLGSLLGGAAVIETVFAYPGLGKLAIDAIGARDYPLIQAFVLLMTVIFIAGNLAVDILYGLVDPRIRVGGRAVGG